VHLAVQTPEALPHSAKHLRALCGGNPGKKCKHLRNSSTNRISPLSSADFPGANPGRTLGLKEAVGARSSPPQLPVWELPLLVSENDSTADLRPESCRAMRGS
jgi:hypothetical protein